MSAVVSDTSVIRAFAHLGRWDLLEKLFEIILVPEAVAEELLHPAGKFRSLDVMTIPFLSVRRPVDGVLVRQLRTELDDGESDAIALAIELRADTILIDEFAGRRVAARLGLRPMGVLGVLNLGKNAGLVSRVKPLVDDLRDNIGFRISEAVYQRFMQDVRE